LRSTTITQVARRAGVSQSTVSYVLSGKRSISEATRARVHLAIRELHYKPHAGARSLRAGRTNVVALVVPFYGWSSEPVLMPYIYGVVEGARQRGWNVMLVTSFEGTSALDEVVGSKMVDGVVLMEVQPDDERLKLVERLGIPAVALGLPSGPGEVAYVDFDFESAGRLCVEHLVSLGHQHIGLLAAPPGAFEMNVGYAHRLWGAVARALEQAGLAFHGLAVEPTMEGANRALASLLSEEPSLGALIVHSEGIIDVLMQSLHQLGKAVPADISVVPIAWAELTKHVVPALTYVSIPAVEMGRTAVELLAEGRPGELLPATLVEGRSTSSPASTTTEG
jgi:DNA-binding LacI/PurR family transcriptional regulator